MEPEGSLTCSQKPVTGLYLEPHEYSSQLPSYFSKAHSNIILLKFSMLKYF
jgi:hypothetical protein